MEGGVEERADAFAGDRSRVGVGVLHGEVEQAFCRFLGVDARAIRAVEAGAPARL